MNAGSVPVFSAAALGRALADPDAAASFSPVLGPGVLAIDLEASAREDLGAALDPLVASLGALPCVSIAVGSQETSARLARLAAACDVHLDAPGEIAPFAAAFEQTRVAAVAFVQLLRLQASLPDEPSTIAQGLAAESFVYSTLQAGPEFGAWLARRRARGRRLPSDAEPACLFTREGDRLTLRLNRPARHNAFSRSLRDALCEGLCVALADPSIAAVVLCGEGPSFCSGGDLDEFGSFPDPATAHAIRTTRSPAHLVARLAGRIRAEIHGACIGAGIELPAFTDHVVADEHTRIELPEVRLGLVPGAGGTVSITRRIGRQRTAWLGLSGRPIDARTALAWGLVDEVRLGQHPPA